MSKKVEAKKVTNFDGIKTFAEFKEQYDSQLANYRSRVDAHLKKQNVSKEDNQKFVDDLRAEVDEFNQAAEQAVPRLAHKLEKDEDIKALADFEGINFSKENRKVLEQAWLEKENKVVNITVDKLVLSNPLEKSFEYVLAEDRGEEKRQYLRGLNEYYWEDESSKIPGKDKVFAQLKASRETVGFYEQHLENLESFFADLERDLEDRKNKHHYMKDELQKNFDEKTKDIKAEIEKEKKFLKDRGIKVASAQQNKPKQSKPKLFVPKLVQAAEGQSNKGQDEVDKFELDFKAKQQAVEDKIEKFKVTSVDLPQADRKKFISEIKKEIKDLNVAGMKDGLKLKKSLSKDLKKAERVNKFVQANMLGKKNPFKNAYAYILLDKKGRKVYQDKVIKRYKREVHRLNKGLDDSLELRKQGTITDERYNKEVAANKLKFDKLYVANLANNKFMKNEFSKIATEAHKERNEAIEKQQPIYTAEKDIAKLVETTPKLAMLNDTMQAHQREFAEKVKNFKEQAVANEFQFKQGKELGGVAVFESTDLKKELEKFYAELDAAESQLDKINDNLIDWADKNNDAELKNSAERYKSLALESQSWDEDSKFQENIKQQLVEEVVLEMIKHAEPKVEKLMGEFQEELEKAEMAREFGKGKQKDIEGIHSKYHDKIGEIFNEVNQFPNKLKRPLDQKAPISPRLENELKELGGRLSVRAPRPMKEHERWRRKQMGSQEQSAFKALEKANPYTLARMMDEASKKGKGDDNKSNIDVENLLKVAPPSMIKKMFDVQKMREERKQQKTGSKLNDGINKFINGIKNLVGAGVRDLDVEAIYVGMAAMSERGAKYKDIKNPLDVEKYREKIVTLVDDISVNRGVKVQIDVAKTPKTPKKPHVESDRGLEGQTIDDLESGAVLDGNKLDENDDRSWSYQEQIGNLTLEEYAEQYMYVHPSDKRVLNDKEVVMYEEAGLLDKDGNWKDIKEVQDFDEKQKVAKIREDLKKHKTRMAKRDSKGEINKGDIRKSLRKHRATDSGVKVSNKPKRSGLDVRDF